VAEASVRVPASTSNLGSGFDCVGFAVDLWLTATVVADDGPGGVTVERDGTLAELPLHPAEDLLHQGFLAGCAAAGRQPPARLRYSASSEIPVARGLGSSAAAFVAGSELANRALGLGLRPLDIADLCAAREGHPDNAGPAALGGGLLGVRAPASHRRLYLYSRLRVHPGLGFVFAIPDFEVRTAEARAALPSGLPFGDAVRAAARSAALVQGLATGKRALLAIALDDVLHTPYRRALIPGFDQVVAAAASAGSIGTTLSGSGSTLMAVAPASRAAAVAEAMKAAWSAAGIRADTLIVRRPARRAARDAELRSSAAGPAPRGDPGPSPG